MRMSIIVGGFGSLSIVEKIHVRTHPIAIRLRDSVKDCRTHGQRCFRQ